MSVIICAWLYWLVTTYITYHILRRLPEIKRWPASTGLWCIRGLDRLQALRAQTDTTSLDQRTVLTPAIRSYMVTPFDATNSLCCRMYDTAEALAPTPVNERELRYSSLGSTAQCPTKTPKSPTTGDRFYPASRWRTNGNIYSSVKRSITCDC